MPFSLDPLDGDAGNRRYFRVNQNGDRYILMQMADPEQFKASEEAVTGTVAVDELPFLNLQRYLKDGACPVPDVVGQNLEAGLILLEDFGDTSLMAATLGQPAERVAELYTQAVDHLLRLQRDTPVDDGCVAHHREYGPELFLWEFDHYVEYGIEALHQVEVKPEHREVMQRHFSALATEIAAGPRVLVHRDYHSRNLMVREDGGLGMIDFQDALMGPPTYDLASLLWDPYVTLPSGLADILTLRYMRGAPLPLAEDFPRLLALTALQRLLKAAGRFVFIDRVKGNPKFLADVPVCLGRARLILAGRPELEELEQVLAAYEPRLAA